MFIASKLHTLFAAPEERNVAETRRLQHCAPMERLSLVNVVSINIRLLWSSRVWLQFVRIETHSVNSCFAMWPIGLSMTRAQLLSIPGCVLFRNGERNEFEEAI
jgi:hypothetical protein